MNLLPQCLAQAHRFLLHCEEAIYRCVLLRLRRFLHSMEGLKKNTLGEMEDLATLTQEPILTIENCYLVTVENGQLLFVDQHAAHERILYNKLWEADAAKSLVRQTLLLPAELELSAEDRACVEEQADELHSLGFTFRIENSRVVLSEVPVLGQKVEAGAFFTAVIQGMTKDRPDPELTTRKHRLFATMACKAAVKAGDSLSEGEKRQLLRDLVAQPTRFTCPHGRPSHLEITSSELEKLFKRTGF